MFNKVKYYLSLQIKSLFELKQTERLWHIPLLASLCVGVPLFIGFFLNKMDYGILSCTAGLVILYLPSSTVAHRMITLVACSFGFMVSFTMGIAFSFNPVLSSIALGLFAFCIQWITNYFQLRAPGNFFFIMVASISSCMPFDLMTIPTRVGLIGLGTMLACILGFLYSLYITRKYPPKKARITIKQNRFSNIVECAIVGVFMGLSLLVGKMLHLSNPYWLPISCAAVMQGVSKEHIWERSFHRILGTLTGLALAWLLISQNLTPLRICIIILAFQFIIEVLVVRHYALAVIFITPMTILLAEAGRANSINSDVLIFYRFFDIVLGSIIGAIGGWFLHHKYLRDRAERQIRKTRVAMFRNKY